LYSFDWSMVNLSTNNRNVMISYKHYGTEVVIIPRLFVLMALIVLMCWLSQTNPCLPRSSYTPTGIFWFDLKIPRWKNLCCRNCCFVKVFAKQKGYFDNRNRVPPERWHQQTIDLSECDDSGVAKRKKIHRKQPRSVHVHNNWTLV
jgi:hypothetical protein